MLNKIVRYLTRLDGVTIATSHDSGSHYFKMGTLKVRISDHFATSCNPPTTLNIVCSAKDFVVTYGNKILSVRNYEALKQCLRHFAMIGDCLKPLAKSSSETVVKFESSEPIVGFSKLTAKQQKAIRKIVSDFLAQNKKVA